MYHNCGEFSDQCVASIQEIPLRRMLIGLRASWLDWQWQIVTTIIVLRMISSLKVLSGYFV
jgi:hypothetical protein